jgi:hypothetical protein
MAAAYAVASVVIPLWIVIISLRAFYSFLLLFSLSSSFLLLVLLLLEFLAHCGSVWIYCLSLSPSPSFTPSV